MLTLFQQQKAATALGNHDEYERLKENIVVAAERHGFPGTRLDAESHVAIYMLQCTALEKMLQWKDAIEIYKKVFMMIDEGMILTPPVQRGFFTSFGRSFYESGTYDKAIYMFDAAIEMNRHYPGVHKYKALAHQQKGELDLAIATMNQAALYETPWDVVNQTEWLKLYDEFCLLRQK